MTYRVVTTLRFEKETKVLFKKDSVLFNRFKKTATSIRDNPECGKPLRNVLKGYRRAHVGHFVLIYEIDDDNNIITLVSFTHYDKAY
ncbi:type II toxin-antitoxin system RelE family toxin [Methanolobus halotolerans]|uniref:Type II toxin-antitoxin system RelE/ParE family toxin n=1 Tax=Methanolobus halotolerans TaxID=2052935 RepID=A0A4E0Q2F3_9EURY|nr:type II toxin-antitoxin system RelE/ParE family toxin [Methanolobus halotolerans]TGC06972.1 type II toxin-antitoxin system RelE/ParE family toxin [Methanolobus halotolerans]